MTSLSWFGALLQVTGLLIAAFGAYRTWHAFAGPEDDFFGPVRSGLNRIRRVLDRILRRKRHVVGTGGVVTASGSVRARGIVGFGELDVTDAAAALKELDSRIRRVVLRTAEDVQNLQDRDEELKAELDAAAAGLDERIRKVATTTREVALDGIRFEVLGLFLAGVGIVVQTVGT